jgi:hypothetical protein
MSVKIIPQSVINAKRFFQETILSGKNILSGNKFLYKKEDIQNSVQHCKHSGRLFKDQNILVPNIFKF